MSRNGIALLLALSALPAAGCARKTPDAGSRYVTAPADPNRNTSAARGLNARGVTLLKEGKPVEAARELKAALEADLLFGPAHNNLGTAYYRLQEYYRAAWEFQYAAKLMPNKPEPKNNLGRVMEAVGRLTDAARHYEQALVMAEDSAEFAGNLARCRIRLGQRDEKTRDLLQQIALKDTRQDWVTWARLELVKMKSTPPEPAATSTTRPAADAGS